MRAAVGPEMGVKASGGIRTREDARQMIAAGATRIGASASVKIVEDDSRLRTRPATKPRAKRIMATTRKSIVRFQERAELLDFLLDAADAMSESLDLDRILSNVARLIKEVVPYDLFAILLYSERRGGLQIRYSIGHREEVVRSLIIKLGEGITGTAASSRQPVLIGDVRADPRYLNALDAVRTELAVPMLARGKLVGVIDMQSTRQNAYKEQDRSLLQLIASRAAVSIDNARLYRRVERQNRTLRTLAHLSQEFSSILALDELLAQDRQDRSRADQFRRVQHSAGGCGAARAAAPVQRALRPARGSGQHPDRQRASPARRPSRANRSASRTRWPIRATSLRTRRSVPKWPCR